MYNPEAKHPGHMLKWRPIGHDLQTTDEVISIGYKPEIPKKVASRKSKLSNRPQKHIICKAIQWQRILDNEELDSLSEIAQNEGLTRARVTKIMNPLRLLPELFIKYLDRIIGDG
jgi:hypothetical protein